MVSKRFKIIFSRKSTQQLKEISDYVTEAASLVQAQKVRQGIKKTADDLEYLPESKPILSGTENMLYNVRYTKKWSYKIIFRILKTTGVVRILTIRHDKENPQDIIGDL